MDLYIGIDLGTSSVKLILVNKDGDILKSVSRDYNLEIPQDGWSQQNPEDWWTQTIDGLSELLSDCDKSKVKGIGSGGQMHGLVILDNDDNVIRPAILWNDGRTANEVDYLNSEIGKDVLSENTANIAFAGFTAPKILWIQKNEPENFKKISKIMLPKDYITYMLTGVFATDYSDASGMLLLDVKNKCWSKKMIGICNISEDKLPKLYESYDVVGNVKKEIADILGLSDNVKVVAGAGDNAAAAIGTGTVSNGKCNISLGTSGTIFISSDSFRVDPNNALHAFAHANGEYHLMACMLSAASCNKWFCEEILHTTDFTSEQIDITDDKLGENNVLFLPYLMGERSPINDTDARGTFVGMSMDTSRSDMVQAILEGVAFALRDSIEIAKKLGIEINESMVCGGGAKSKLWTKIIANVLNIRLTMPKTEEGPGYGGAMLAMVGCKAYDSVSQCAENLVKQNSFIDPDPELVNKYEAKYNRFKMIYPSLKEFFKSREA